MLFARTVRRLRSAFFGRGMASVLLAALGLLNSAGAEPLIPTAPVGGAHGAIVASSAPIEPVVDREGVIRRLGVLRACIWPQYYAISFRNPRDGQLSGIDIDLARLFAAELGAAVHFIDSSFAAFADDLDANRCDIAMFAIGPRAAQASRVDLSRPHLASGVYAVTTVTNRQIRTWADIDQPGRVVAVAAGSFVEPAVIELIKKAEVLVVRPPARREDEVVSGRADVFITDFPYARGMLFQQDWARVVAPPQPVAVAPYSFAVARGQPDWLGRVDAFIEGVRRDGRLRAAARAHGLEAIVLAPPGK